jgi:type IV pilus assembly protein PilW
VIARPKQAQRGVTLVELMVAMVLGLLVVAGAVSLTVANRRSYSTNEGLSQVQESGRTAFELLARDVRQAGILGCDNRGRIANVLDPAGGFWWQTWFGVRGFGGALAGAAPFGTARGERVAGTDALQTQGLQGAGMTVATHATTSQTITVNGARDAVVNDIMVICDFDHATIFQVRGLVGATSFTHTNGGSGPGNCSNGLGFPTVCTVGGTAHAFLRNSLVAPLSATEWYIGQSGRTTDTGRSLFRRRLTRGGAVAMEELVTDVTDMQIRYRTDSGTAFVPAATLSTADWSTVVAARISLRVDSGDRNITTTPTANSGRISREFNQVFALRNRVP